jgi:hypothetical protein
MRAARACCRTRVLHALLCEGFSSPVRRVLRPRVPPTSPRYPAPRALRGGGMVRARGGHGANEARCARCAGVGQEPVLRGRGGGAGGGDVGTGPPAVPAGNTHRRAVAPGYPGCTYRSLRGRAASARTTQIPRTSRLGPGPAVADLKASPLALLQRKARLGCRLSMLQRVASRDHVSGRSAWCNDGSRRPRSLGPRVHWHGRGPSKGSLLRRPRRLREEGPCSLCWVTRGSPRLGPTRTDSDGENRDAD